MSEREFMKEQKQNQQMKQLMKGTLILSLAALIAKILSAVYRVPFENLVGNRGFYIYQQIYPIYGVGMTCALSGFPVFISKLVAQEDDLTTQIGLAQKLFSILAILGIIIFSGLMLFAQPLAKAMGDQALAGLIKTIAWLFLLMPFVGTARGFYQGRLHMIPTALSQVTEQLLRVTLIIVVAVLTVKNHWSLYRMGSWAMGGALIGAVGALIVLSPFYCKYFFKGRYFQTIQITTSALWQKLLTEGLLICLFASLMVLLQLVDSFTITKALTDRGVSYHQAQNLKGIYDRAQPLVQLGLVVALSFASSLFPSLSQHLKAKRYQLFKRSSQLSLKVGLLFACAATVGMILLMPEINTFLFKDSLLDQTLAIYCLSIIPMTFISAYNAILQSTNQLKVTLISLVATLIIKISFNHYLILIFGITGSSICTVLALLVGAALMLVSSKQLTKGLIADFSYWLKLIISLVVMSVLVIILKELLINYTPLNSSHRLSSLLIILVTSSCGMLAFFLAVLNLHLFTIREWLMVPGGDKLLSLSKLIAGKIQTKKR